MQVQYFQGTSTMTTFFVPGSPYMTFQYASATPLLTSYQGAITNFAGTTVPTGGQGKRCFPNLQFKPQRLSYQCRRPERVSPP